jgi:NACHT domain
LINCDRGVIMGQNVISAAVGVVALNSLRARSNDSVEPRRVAGRLRLRLRRLWSALVGPLRRMSRSRRARRRRRSIDEQRRWLPGRPLVGAVKIASAVGGVFLLVAVAWSLYVVIEGKPSSFLGVDVDAACRNTGASCSILVGIIGPLFSLAFASGLFLLFRPWFVSRPYLRKAREEPERVVDTAGSIIGEVVGRDELCHVMIEDLRDRDTRRPHVVVGGVGTGKTALLVRLTQLLAERRAVPVPVRLRDARELDFRELARKRFIADANAALQSDTEGERVWRYLCRNDRVVILADGLEEALIEDKERDNRIRLAIRQAGEHRLPLIVASRPHDSLRDLEATIVDLEPLSEEAALEYLQRDSGEDERRLDWVVETADVAETPLYLQITRQLQRAGLMEHLTARRGSRRLDTRSVDRAELRLRLLETWTQALIDGHFATGVPLSREDRQATVDQLSVLACLGLQRDRLQVEFDDFETLRRLPSPPPVITEIHRRLTEVRHGFDIRLAATWGMRLGLVEVRGNGVRFPHSIIQAYLGSRVIDLAMRDPGFAGEALEDPGRELLIALVMNSRASLQRDRRPGPAGPAPSAAQAPDGTTPEGSDGRLQSLLRAKARQNDHVKALYLFAASLQVDSVDKDPAHRDIAADIAESWPYMSAQDKRSLEEAKLNLVRRFGEAVKMIASRRPADPAHTYCQLYNITIDEPTYSIRVEGAQEIGAGGDSAFNALKGHLGPLDGSYPRNGRAAAHAGQAGHGDQAGQAGDVTPAPAARDDDEREWRERVVRAWLAPLLAGSVTDNMRDAKRNLEQWLQYVGERDGTRGESDLRLGLEVALAQGFKYAANRRGRHPHANPETRAFLVEQAREMLRRTSFWFTRLTLVHALCLWSLADGPVHHSAAMLRARRRDADHDTLVEHWAPFSGGRAEHPFVVEARKLAVWALETGQPERFIWIDESGVVAKIGSRPANPGSPRKHNLWVPPSTGWTALHPRAQKLVADVLLLLNLAERGEPRDRNRRLRRTSRPDLPPCLAGNRSPLDPTRTVGMAATSEPGSNCRRGCPFELCPYPPKGEENYRIELSEAFCRRQHALMSGGSVRRRAAPWQEALPGDLKQFWKQMGQRSQPSESNHFNGPERDGRRDRRR